MASHSAISETCRAIMRLLEEGYHPDLFQDGLHVDFEVFQAKEFRKGVSGTALSLFLCRIETDRTLSLAVRTTPEGVERWQLSVELRLILTAWAQTSALQQELMGWAMRMLADYPVLPAALLNGPEGGVFHEDESLELHPDQLSTEDLMHVWDRLGVDYELSVPYVVNGIRLDSEREQGSGIVRETRLGYAEVLE